MSSLSLSRIPRLYQFALLAVLVVAVALVRSCCTRWSARAPRKRQLRPLHPPTNVHRLSPRRPHPPRASAAASARRDQAHAPAASPTHARRGRAAQHAGSPPPAAGAHRRQHKPRPPRTLTAAAADARGGDHACRRRDGDQPAATAPPTRLPPTARAPSRHRLVNDIESQLAAKQDRARALLEPGASHRPVRAARTRRAPGSCSASTSPSLRASEPGRRIRQLHRRRC